MKVEPHEFPFLVFPYEDRTWENRGWTWMGITAALISPKHVLSCRHCFHGYNKTHKPDPKSYEIGFGKTVQQNDEGVVKRKVLNITFHSTLDFAIIVLKAKAPLSEQVKTIHLPEIGSDYTGQKATVAGPGNVEHTQQNFPWDLDPNTLLMKVAVKVGPAPGETCPEKTHLCFTQWSGDKKPGEPGFGGACSGDSGSPFFVCGSTPDDCTVLAVVTSQAPYHTKQFKRECVGDSYGASVIAVRPWIDSVVGCLYQ